MDGRMMDGCLLPSGGSELHNNRTREAAVEKWWGLRGVEEHFVNFGAQSGDFE